VRHAILKFEPFVSLPESPYCLRIIIFIICLLTAHIFPFFFHSLSFFLTDDVFGTQFDFELKHQSTFEEERINYAVDIVAFDKLRLDAAELVLRAAYTAATSDSVSSSSLSVSLKKAKSACPLPTTAAFGAIAIPKAADDSLGDLNSDLLDEWREVDSDDSHAESVSKPKASSAAAEKHSANANVTNAHIVATLYQIFQTTVRGDTSTHCAAICQNNRCVDSQNYFVFLC
jgi:hypothetical protein